MSQIISRRTKFEHLVNSRDGSPSVYARYATYEMNLESLRKKRVKRLGIKMPVHTGQRRIYFIFDRATKKFHGDLGLWMQNVEYARRCKANKKVEELLTRMLRMHPNKAELWIYAANWVLDVEGDVGAARGYLQRGLRFCERSQDLWIEYAKLELIHVAKLAGRRQILGLDGPKANQGDLQTATEEAGFDADTIALPSITAADINPTLNQKDEAVSEMRDKLASSPALAGAVPLAIFDAAMRQFSNNEELALRFFDMFAEFESVPCLRRILQHVLDSLHSAGRHSAGAAACSFTITLAGLNASSPDFPAALGDCLKRIAAALDEWQDNREDIAIQVVKLLAPLSASHDLDESLRIVVDTSLRRHIKLIRDLQIEAVAEELRKNRKTAAAKALLNFSPNHLGSGEGPKQAQLTFSENSAPQIA